VRPKQIIRTYHSLDAQKVPVLSRDRVDTGLISGATNQRVYPLRTNIVNLIKGGNLKGIEMLRHPGYGLKGNHSNAYLQTLNNYKVHIATASIYGFALRKIIESVACGCTAITTLPEFEVMPEIDQALVRVPYGIKPNELTEVVREQVSKWDYDKAVHFSEKAKEYYDYRRLYARLCADIERKYLNWSMEQ
jgi:hypothetical protein